MAINTWAPLFSKIVDSSLWEEDDSVVKVFLTMLAKKDADNVVRGNAFNISRWAKKTEEETLLALKVLSEPDKRRIEPQPFEGRRIGKVDDGWLILNGEYYRGMISKFKKKDYNRQWMEEYRASLKLLTPGQKEYIAKVKEMKKKLKHWHKLATDQIGVNGNPTAQEVRDLENDYQAAVMPPGAPI